MRIVAVYIAASFSWVVLERRITADLIAVHGPKERMIHTDKGQKVGQMQTKTQRKKMEALHRTRETSRLNQPYYGNS